ncbi:hypothetical protein Tco_0947557, partial [Tanacetum coccineum]
MVSCTESDEFCETSSDDNSISKNFLNEPEPPQDKISEDPFGIYNIHKKQDNKEAGIIAIRSPPSWISSLKRHLSDHRPIIMREVVTDYGPSPFRVYQSWFHKKGSISSLSPWNCILKELNSLSAKGINLLALLKKKVGNGANTLFWEDCWINDVPLSRSFPRLYALELKKSITVADKLIDASFVASFRRNPRGGVEEEQLHHLVELVGSISLSPSNDRWAWLLGSS